MLFGLVAKHDPLGKLRIFIVMSLVLAVKELVLFVKSRYKLCTLILDRLPLNASTDPYFFF